MSTKCRYSIREGGDPPPGTPGGPKTPVGGPKTPGGHPKGPTTGGSVVTGNETYCAEDTPRQCPSNPGKCVCKACECKQLRVRLLIKGVMVPTWVKDCKMPDGEKRCSSGGTQAGDPCALFSTINRSQSVIPVPRAATGTPCDPASCETQLPCPERFQCKCFIKLCCNGKEVESEEWSVENPGCSVLGCGKPKCISASPQFITGTSYPTAAECKENCKEIECPDVEEPEEKEVEGVPPLK